MTAATYTTTGEVTSVTNRRQTRRRVASGEARPPVPDLVASATVREKVFRSALLREKLAGVAHMEIPDALDMVGLEAVADLPYGYLSTGQKRRIAIARLLLNWRPVWLLDEPTAGLDKASERQFAALIEAHREDGWDWLD